MSDEHRAALHADGVVTLERHLDDRVTVGLIRTLDEPVTAVGPNAVTATLVKRGIVFARRNLLHLAGIRRFVRSGPVRCLIEAFAPGLVPVRGILFDKRGDANWTVPWHQDRSIAVAARHDTPGFGPWSTKAGVVHVQPPIDVLRSMLTLRFSLDPCGPDNGPLRAVHGTHRSLLTRAEIDSAISTGVHTICATDVGGVVVMRPLLLHASSPARRATRRRVLHVEFGPAALPGRLGWAVA